MLNTKKIVSIKNAKNLQSIMLSDDYMVGVYNGLELAQSILENREPIYKNSNYRNCILNNPNIKNSKLFIVEKVEE